MNNHISLWVVNSPPQHVEDFQDFTWTNTSWELSLQASSKEITLNQQDIFHISIPFHRGEGPGITDGFLILEGCKIIKYLEERAALKGSYTNTRWLTKQQYGEQYKQDDRPTHQ